MTCQACGRDLDADARFCPACGAAATIACIACGAELDADARFCKHCGRQVAHESRSARDRDGEDREGGHRAALDQRERKVATLLFADIVGFTELGERLDAEVVNQLVSDAFDRLATEVERYGGTVEKYAGDAMLAVFGVPASHEDDPERAVRAALEMQSVVSATADAATPLRIRIGIETGEVLADPARATDERDRFVTGDPVNTAARLQSAAGPSTVVVGPVTYAATRGIVEYEELPSRELKGKELPMSMWRAIRVRARRGGLRAPLGIEAPLIGRDEELALLKETVRRTMAQRRPHMVTVVGEAGVGKTRLVWELEKYLDGLPDTLHWRKGRCYSYASVSYSPLVEAVKADCRVSDDDAPDVMRRKVDERVADLFGDRDRGHVTAAVQTLFGLVGASGLSQDELFEAWRSYLATVAERHPLVFVVEDIHWADDSTLDLLEFVARWGDAPIALLCMARPELLERRQTWGGGIPNSSLVRLAPLEPAESATMLDRLLDGALPVDVSERVVSMAHGNPLFTEELVRMFVDQGVLRESDGRWQLARPVTDLAVPDSVQAVLAARLDGLATEEKRVAQEAAVVGRIFWDVIVSHLRGRSSREVGTALQALRVKELVQPREPSSMAGASEWSFHHVLVRDVAYDSLPKFERALLHAQVADWAETNLADRGDEFAELIAAHQLQALRYREQLRGGDLTALRGHVLDAAHRATRRAASVYDLHAVRRWQLVVIEMARLLDRPPLERAGLALEFHRLTSGELDAHERVEVLSEAVSLTETVGTLDEDGRALQGRLRAALANAMAEDDRVPEAKSLLRRAIADLEGDRPSAARAAAVRTLCWVLWHAYEFEEAAVLAQEAMDEARDVGDDETYRWALHESGVVLAYRGEMDEALDRVERSMRLSREAGDRRLLDRCTVNLSAFKGGEGYPSDEILAVLEPAISVSRRSGSYQTLGFLLSNAADMYLVQGRLDEVLALRDEALDTCVRAGNPHMVGSVHTQHALALLAMGQHDAAARAVDEAEATSTDDPQLRDRIPLLRALLTFPGEPEATLAALRQARAAESPDSMEAWRLALWEGRMAFRLRDVKAMQDATDALDRVRQPYGIGRRLQRRWHRALAEADAAGLREVGAGLEQAGMLQRALEAWSDEALARARQGRDEGRTEAVRRRCQEVGYHPLLGPLPETRWIGTGQLSSV